MIVNPGIRRFLGSAIQRLFNSASFYATLTHSLVPERGTGSPTFTRATTATVRDNEGVLRTAIAGEARFEGARRVRNLISTTSEDFSNAAWTKINTTVVVNQAVAPNGTTTAALVYPTTTGALRYVWQNPAVSNVVVGTKWMQSFYVKSAGKSWVCLGLPGGGVNEGAYFNISTGTVGTVKAGAVNPTITDVGNGWWRCSLNNTDTDGLSAYPLINVVDGDNSLNVTTSGTDGVYIWGAQLEDITGRTDQTTPSEYVSVGVESAPYYHGSMVDGVKCFPTDLAGNALPTRYTYDAVSLNGVAGTYVSTPDSVAASITGDLTLEWIGSIYNYAIINTLISKWNVASYLLRISATKKVLVDVVGTNGITIVTGASVPFNDGDDNVGVKVVVDADNGAGGSTTSIYTTIDGGANWTLLQAATVTAGVLVIADTTDAVMVGNYGTTSGQLAGKTYRARIYNNSTLAVDFDASRYAGGTTLTGSTGETWTLNGSAVIHPTNTPMLGYLAEGARTNYQPHSNNFSAWTPSGAGVSLAQNAVDDDGATTAWTATITGAGQYITYATTGVAADQTCTLSINLWPVDAGTTQIAVYNTTGGAQFYAICNPTTGNILGGFTGGASFSSTSVTPIAGGGYRFSVTGSTGGTGAQTNNPVIYYGDGVDVKHSKVQLELGSFASSYIATTTIAVARNADVLTYSSAGNVDGTKGWAYAELSTQYTTASGYLDAVSSGGGTGVQILGIGAGAASTTAFTTDGSTLITKSGLSDMATGARKRVASWGGSTYGVTGDGLAPATNNFDGTMATTASIGIGCNAAGTGQWFGTIRNVRIGQRQLSSSELGAITA